MSTLAAALPDTPVAAIPADGLRAIVLRPFARTGWRQRLLLLALAAVVVNGLVAWTIQLQDGMGVAGYNDHAFWAIYIADVVTFIGVSYGGAVISAILRLTGAEWRAPLTRLAEGMAVVTVVIGGAFIIPHLGRPDRILELVTRPNLSSPIFWDFVAISTYALGSIIFFLLPLIPDMAILRRVAPERLGRRNRLYSLIAGGWTGSPRQRRVLNRSLTLIAILIIPLAVSVHSVLSWAFALVSRPWWHESIWAPYFVVAALYSGVALVILTVAAFRKAYHLEEQIPERHFVRLGFILATFAAAYLYLTFADILPDAYVGEPGPAAIFQALLVGQFAPYFWTFVVGAGVLPLLLVAIPRTRTAKWMVVASAIIVPAMWMKRMLMVLDPATFDRVTGLFGGYQFTWVSISVTLAGVAAIPLLLILLFRVVPLVAVDEMEEVDRHHAALEAAPSRAGRTVHAAENGSVARAGAIGLLAVAVAVAACLALLTPARASTSKTPPPPKAALHLQATDTKQGVQLTATLDSAAHAPIRGATVTFLQKTYDFGPSGRLFAIGTATTGDDGTASLVYTSTVGGSQEFDVQFAGDPADGSATASTTVKLASAVTPAVVQPPKPLADVGDWLLVVLLFTVASIWITLIAQLVRVRRACRVEVAETVDSAATRRR